MEKDGIVWKGRVCDRTSNGVKWHGAIWKDRISGWSWKVLVEDGRMWAGHDAVSEETAKERVELYMEMNK